MTSSWLPVLAGGVGGALLTNLSGEWRLWRTNRREDKHRFASERLQCASDVLRLATNVQRLQTRLMAARLRRPEPDRSSEVDDLTARYFSALEAIDDAASRFRILFPESQQQPMFRVLDAIDELRDAVEKHEDVRQAAETLRDAEQELAESSRRYIVGVKD